MKNWFKEMLSTSDASSCTRFCVVMVFSTIMFNWTFLNIYSMIDTGQPVTMNIQEIIALFGMVGAKLGQKKLENK